jgi:hypothetical protein
MVFFPKPLAVLVLAVTATAHAQQAPYFRQQAASTTTVIATPGSATVPAPDPSPASVDPMTLPVGAYYRPTGAEVSGFVGATTRFVRSPCPALNTLANHGFFPRDGKNIKKEVFVSVLMDVFNLDRGLASFHATLLSATTSLSDLGKHNFIEHDFSVVHADSVSQADPSAVDANLAADLLGRGVDGVLGVQQLGEASVARMAVCKAKPTGCPLSGFHRTLAFREQASILRVFGGANSESCRVDFAQSFLVDERIPADWRKPAVQVRLADLSATGTKIQKVMMAK